MFRDSYNGSNKKIFWQEMWRDEFEDALERDPVVIVPVGSIEQHGPHCPMDVDIVGPFYMAVEAAKRTEAFPVIVAPPVWSGFTHYNKGFAGTISLRIETFLNLLQDVCLSIHENGFKRMILVNGHGGNDAPVRVVRDTLAEHNCFVVGFSWWKMVEPEMLEWGDADEGAVGHGGEWETSVQLHLREHLIQKDLMNDDVFLNPFSPEMKKFAGFSERRRDTRDVTGTMGSALSASAEKGGRVFELATTRLMQVAAEFHAQPVREYFELGSYCPK
jgi:creatinine amidohydrolase